MLQNIVFLGGFLELEKLYIEERAVNLAHYIIDSKDTVRGAAKKFGVSKSTVHKDVSERLQKTWTNGTLLKVQKLEQKGVS